MSLATHGNCQNVSQTFPEYLLFFSFQTLLFLGSTESEISSQCQRNCESSNIHLDFRIDVPLHPQTHCTLASLLLVSLSAPCLSLASHIPDAFHALPLPPKLSSAASRLHGSVQLRSAMLCLAIATNISVSRRTCLCVSRYVCGSQMHDEAKIKG